MHMVETKQVSVTHIQHETAVVAVYLFAVAAASPLLW